MTTVEQRQAWVLTKVMAGEVEVGEAAERIWASEWTPARSPDTIRSPAGGANGASR